MIGGGQAAEAAFNATTTVSLTSSATNAAADNNTILSIPTDNYNFSAVITTTPASATIHPSPGHPSFSSGTHPVLGDIGATLTSNTNLGLTNGPCNTNLQVDFTMLVATVDTTSTVVPLLAADAGPLGTLETMATDDGSAPNAVNNPGPQGNAIAGNGLAASVEAYPSYLNDIFDGLQPLRRLVGNTVVASSQVVLNFVVFEPGALKAHFPPPHPFHDLDNGMGYTSVTVLQDPTAPTAPSSITDFCAALESDTVTLGTTEGNVCRNSPGSSPNCDTDNETNNPPSVGDNSGRVAYTNPSTAGTYLWLNVAQSLRDADGDGIENAFDTCPFTPNTDGNPRTTSGPDGDMIDSACDPSPGTNTGSNNHDGDTKAGRPWLNAQDNCPTVVNNDNLDSEGLPGPAYEDSAPRGGPKSDGIGDACDPDDVQADGQFDTVLNVNAVCIGGTDGDGDGFCASGGSLPNDPDDSNINLTPENYSLVFEMPIAHSGSGLNSVVGGTVSDGQGLDYNESSLANDGSSQSGNLPGGGSGAAHHGTAQPYQVCNDGDDNDGDGLTDLLDPDCRPVGLTSTDTDGDGFPDQREYHIGTDALGRCEVGAVPNRSTDWPLDYVSGGPLNSTDKIDIGDLTTYVAPVRRLGASPGDAAFHPRWDIDPGPGLLGTWINIGDITAFVAGSSGTPPMFGGATRAFNGPFCSAHPTYGD